jgi:alkylated DNA repair dioxygenase AlkB
MNATSRRRVRSFSPSPQADLFTAPNGLPEGFCYRPNVISRNDEEALAREVADLPFKPFDFHGYLANRQVVSFGYRYDYDRGAVVEASPFPSFLVSLRNKVAAIFDRPAEDFRQALINEYRPGAEIGWHRDKAQVDEVVGVSLLAPCALRFRRKAAETWERVSLAVEPCSAYLLSGAARTVWEHSIPALDELRYSITLRTLVAKAPSGEECY